MSEGPMPNCATLNCPRPSEVLGYCEPCWFGMTRPERRRLLRAANKAAKRGLPFPAAAEPPRYAEPTTWWNGEPCTAQRVRVVVGKSPVPTWWCADLEGEERPAVRVDYGCKRFYLDNEDESGWKKVTEGRGSPQWAHRSLPVDRESPAFDDAYVWGTVEDFEYIADHVRDDRAYVEGGMRFGRSEDRRFALLALDYFHHKSPVRRSLAAMREALDALPDRGQWRQGASTHQLVIWPETPDPRHVMGDGYWGTDAIEVGDFTHGTYTWFCIMAWAYLHAVRGEHDQDSAAAS